MIVKRELSNIILLYIPPHYNFFLFSYNIYVIIISVIDEASAKDYSILIHTTS